MSDRDRYARANRQKAAAEAAAARVYTRWTAHRELAALIRQELQTEFKRGVAHGKKAGRKLSPKSVGFPVQCTGCALEGSRPRRTGSPRGWTKRGPIVLCTRCSKQSRRCLRCGSFRYPGAHKVDCPGCCPLPTTT